jgi:S-adenosylmethionine:tRNA ribosyltransferase-isomerase
LPRAERKIDILKAAIGDRQALARLADDEAVRVLACWRRGRTEPLAGLAVLKRIDSASMRVADFDFDLPENRIALRPANPRDSARLLHVDGRALGDFIVRELPLLLKRGDMLVLNDTRVIPAQLRGSRPSRDRDGERVEVDVTLIKRLDPEERAGARWRAFLRPAKRVKAGDKVDFGKGLAAEVERRGEADAILRFDKAGAEFDAALARTGAPPLPPYIARKRKVTPDDAVAYQTIYAAEAGSVAAPTAGLHFTHGLFERLDAAGVRRETITLHVGAGTFLPVTAEDTRDHVMHAEWGEITKEQAARINAAREAGGRIVAVGTTSLRLLESATDANGVVHPFVDETDIFITPGYRFRAVDALLTNFHLPRSTLFMLVCAFAGTDVMRRAYAHAIERDYRFYSYGDACLLECKSPDPSRRRFAPVEDGVERAEDAPSPAEAGSRALASARADGAGDGSTPPRAPRTAPFSAELIDSIGAVKRAGNRTAPFAAPAGAAVAP